MHGVALITAHRLKSRSGCEDDGAVSVTALSLSRGQMAPRLPEVTSNEVSFPFDEPGDEIGSCPFSIKKDFCGRLG